MSICPKEVKDSRTENRWQAALRSTTKTVLFGLAYRICCAQILSLFFLLKVKKQQHCSALFLWVLMEENPQQGPEPPAPCPGPLHPQSHTASATGQGRCIPNAATSASAQTMRGAQMKPGAQETTSLFFFAPLIICSTCPCREETGIVEKAMAVLKSYCPTKLCAGGDYQ